MIGVVHTVGKNIGVNLHVHALVPEMKIIWNEVKVMEFFDYKYFRKVWQYKLINYMISKNPKKKAEYLKMFKDYSNGFYIK
ncbi:transposase [Clostridium algidicarnis]|uniref:transposase n=1 Tax=Clostridium algidicarnis TaxID=37659 RepID=UPI001C0E88C7|nr:transposase [Clostridium algidicarnis]MBU3228121.1 transposase [Clostridium algidicarnis]MBU3252005.1 transposase [Clostridium algidicarnis]